MKLRTARAAWLTASASLVVTFVAPASDGTRPDLAQAKAFSGK